MIPAPVVPVALQAELRALNEANLTHRCDVFVPVTMKGSLGQVTTAWPTTPAVAGLPCRVSAQSALTRETVVAGAEAAPADSYLVTFAAGSSVPKEAKLRVTGSVAVTTGAPVAFTLWLAVQGSPAVQPLEVARRVLAVVTTAVPGA